MTEKEFLDFLQKQKDFEDEERKRHRDSRGRAWHALEELDVAVKHLGTSGKKLLEQFATSDNPSVAAPAREWLANLSETEGDERDFR